jgi:hypothetical protein
VELAVGPFFRIDFVDGCKVGRGGTMIWKVINVTQCSNVAGMKKLMKTNKFSNCVSAKRRKQFWAIGCVHLSLLS